MRVDVMVGRVLRGLARRAPVRTVLLAEPAMRPEAATVAGYGRQAAEVCAAGGDVVEYAAPGPKHEFLRYLVRHHPVLLHGSGDATIREFVPRPQTDADGRPISAVFASSDGLWPIFFAVVDRQRVTSLRNACITGRRPEDPSRYPFSIDSDPADRASWRDGVVYVLDRTGFTRHPGSAEWHNPQPVRPLGGIAVTPDDFPFRADVLRHVPGQSMLATYRELARRRRKVRV